VWRIVKSPQKIRGTTDSSGIREFRSKEPLLVESFVEIRTYQENNSTVLSAITGGFSQVGKPQLEGVHWPPQDGH